jgi:hypothetical protein
MWLQTMDYYEFLEEFDSYNEWNNIQKRDRKDLPKLDTKFPKFQSNVRSLKDAVKKTKDDRINSPSHYTSGKAEAIFIIEDAIKDAPSAIYGMLQGQVLKYMLRVWLKDSPIEDMKKARWYLDRLIEHYENPPGDR